MLVCVPTRRIGALPRPLQNSATIHMLVLQFSCIGAVTHTSPFGLAVLQPMKTHKRILRVENGSMARALAWQRALSHTSI